ncbi:MAG: hypothetical protein WCJ09_16090 [Planctomycetota bacterium]
MRSEIQVGSAGLDDWFQGPGVSKMKPLDSMTQPVAQEQETAEASEAENEQQPDS